MRWDREARKLHSRVGGLLGDMPVDEPASFWGFFGGLSLTLLCEVRTTQRPWDAPGPGCITGWHDTQCVSTEEGPGAKLLRVVYFPPPAEEPWIAGAFLPLLCKGVGSSMDFGDPSPPRPWQPSPAQPCLSPHGHFSSTAGGAHPRHRSQPWVSCKLLLLCCGTCTATNRGRRSSPGSIWRVHIGKATNWDQGKTTNVWGLVCENMYERCRDGCPG